jgi:hypothetical protein
VQWPLDSAPVLSAKDAVAPRLSDVAAELPFVCTPSA